MDTHEPLGAPELPAGSTVVPAPPSTTPQLIRATKPTLPPALPAESIDEPDNLNEHLDDPGDPDGLVAADDQQQWREEHPAPPATPIARPRKKRRWPTAVLLLVLLVIATAAVYWFGNHQAAAPAAKTKSSGQSSSSNSSAASATTAATKHYDSTNFTLGFDYPADWQLSDTASKLAITSPSLALTTAAGAKTNGHVLLTIQNQQPTIAGYPADGAVAALVSNKLTYKQPTTVQRAQTYLSYLAYGNPSGLDALYITGDNGYQQGQQVPQSDLIKGNPLISVNFVTCSNPDCSSGTPMPLTILASSWQTTAASNQITNLLQSLQLN